MYMYICNTKQMILRICRLARFRETGEGSARVIKYPSAKRNLGRRIRRRRRRRHLRWNENPYRTDAVCFVSRRALLHLRIRD